MQLYLLIAAIFINFYGILAMHNPNAKNDDNKITHPQVASSSSAEAQILDPPASAPRWPSASAGPSPIGNYLAQNAVGKSYEFYQAAPPPPPNSLAQYALPAAQHPSMMAQILVPNQHSSRPSSSSHYPQMMLPQYPILHQQPIDPLEEAFIRNIEPVLTDSKSQAAQHYTSFMKYKSNESIQNIYPLSKAQLEFVGIGQLEIQQKITGAEKISEHDCLHTILLGEEAKYLFSQIFYNHNTYLTLNKYLDVDSRTKILERMFNRANGFFNTDSSDLIELLVTSTPKERKSFSTVFKGAEVRSHGNYHELLKTLVKRGFQNWDFSVDEGRANQEILHLFNYYDAYKKKDNSRLLQSEAWLVQILGKNNHSQLRKTFQSYRKSFNQEFYWHTHELLGEKRIAKDHFLQTVHAIAVDVGMGRPHFFAMKLAEKLSIILGGTLSDDPHIDVQRILITRARIDLLEIADAYAKLPGRRPLLQELQEAQADKLGARHVQVKLYAKIVETVMKTTVKILK